MMLRQMSSDFFPSKHSGSERPFTCCESYENGVRALARLRIRLRLNAREQPLAYYADWKTAKAVEGSSNPRIYRNHRERDVYGKFRKTISDVLGAKVEAKIFACQKRQKKRRVELRILGISELESSVGSRIPGHQPQMKTPLPNRYILIESNTSQRTLISQDSI